jgi:hypothetical protein
MRSPSTVGVIFIGTEGYLEIPDYGSYYTFLGPKREPGPSKIGNKGDLSEPHFANFIQAVRSRKASDLHAGPRELHHSAALAHLANISLRTRRMIEFDPHSERIVGNEEANKLLTRTYRSPYVVPERV